MAQVKWQGKQVHGVERLEEQCNLLNGMDTVLAIFALNETLIEQEHLRLGIINESSIMKLIESYRQGSVRDPKVFNLEYDRKNFGQSYGCGRNANSLTVFHRKASFGRNGPFRPK